MSNVAAGKDTDDEGEVLNDVEKTLNSLNIALRSSKGEWRSFEDVLDEVAEKWEKFSDTERSHIATAIAGTRQQENFRAMMNNWDEVTRLVGVAANSTGSASERMEIYLDSVEAKTNNLKAAWENFVMSLNQSDSWKNFLDMLTGFLEKLQYVDWDKVLKVLAAFMALSALTKIIGAITTAVTAIKAAAAAGGVIAGLASAATGLLPVLLAVAGGIAAIAVAVKSVQNNSTATLKDIEERKNALKDEESSVRELYKRYSELEGKSKYYSLTAEEKQELVDITKELVEKYGLETTGVDALTGKYNLANDALEKYIQNLEREKRILSSEEEKALKEEAKNDVKDIGKAKDRKSELENQYGKALLTGTDEEQKEIIKLLGQVAVGEGKKSRGAGGLSKEGQEMIDSASKILREKYGYTTEDFNSLFTNNKLTLASTLSKASGIDNWALPSKWTDDDYTAILNYLQKNAVIDYYKQDTTISAKGKEVAEDVTRLLKNKLGEDVNSSLEGIISNTLAQAFSQNGMEITDVDKFIDEYTENFVNKINANGKELGKVLDRYNELQNKVNNGTLSAQEFDEYKNSLHTYIEMQKEALLATGLSEEKVNELMSSFENQAVSSLNVQLLELNENLKNNKDISETTKAKYSQFVTELTSLQSSFKNGAINSNQYFDELNKKISNIDTSNIEELNKTFGDTENYLKTISALFGDTKNYLDSLWTTFKGGGDSLEFYNNFDSASNSIITLVNSLQQLDSASDKIDLTTITTGNDVIKDKVSAKLGFEVDDSQIKRAVDYINKLDGEKLDVKIEADGLKDAEDGFDDILHAVEEVSDGTIDLQDNTDDLVDSLKELEGLNLNEVDSAFETLKAGFSNLSGDVTSLIGTANEEIQNSAKYMSQWLFDIANSDKAYAETAKNAILGISESTGNTIKDITETNVEAIAQGLMADEQNANTFAAAANSIASQSMQTAVKNLGKTLETMGNALANLNITVPIKLKGAETHIEVAGVPIVSLGFDGLDSELSIGGEGTKGLSDIGNALSEFGKSLQDDSVSNILANQFTPIQSQYTPTLGDTKSGGSGSGSGYTPSGGGSKKGSGSGNNYSAEDAAEDKKSILNDIEKYEADIDIDLEDQTEELINQYNLERNKLDTLKEELDYYDEIYDVTENTTKWLETQLKVLDEESTKVAEMQNANEKIDAQRQKIYKENKKYNVESWFDSEGNETLAYGNLLNSFEYQKEAIQKETAQKMREVYNSIAGSTDKNTISDAKKRIQNIQEEGDNRVKAIDKEREKVENIYSSVSKLNDAWDENQEKIREALTELNNRIKSIRDELIDDIMEQLERAVDKMNTSIEKDVTRLEQLKQVQESYNDILNDTIETQQELEDELKANMDSYQYLDDTMRQLMFNEDDYKQLSGVLEGIQEDIADIWEDHYNQIQNLTEDEMYKAEYITNETERQLAAKQKEYELAKAELDVAKAQTNLNNVLNERDTRMFVNGEWTWVANPENVKNARQQLADAEREKTRLEREKEQQVLIDAMDKIIDSDNLQIDKNNDLLKNIQEAIEQETEEVKSVEEALLNADKANLPALTTTLIGALGSDGGYMKELLGEINHSQVELATALRGQTIEQATQQLKSGTMKKADFNELVTRLGFSFNEATGMITTQDGSFAAHYSGWTKKSNKDTQTTTAKNGVQVTGSTKTTSSTTSISSAQAKTDSKNLEQIAKEVWLGKWGNGQDRKNRLTAAGYDYNAVQKLVNKGYSYFFDKGGVATGIGQLAKDTIEPERVLSPRQTKAFENLVNNLTTNPVLNALSRTPSIKSNWNGLTGETNNSKNYHFSNFTVQANDIEEFISSIETMIPMNK